jgi:hypothetical protein
LQPGGVALECIDHGARFVDLGCDLQGRWGGCVCDMTVRPVSVTKSLTYTTSGAVLTESETDGTVSQSTYCLSGKTLTQHTDEKIWEAMA